MKKPVDHPLELARQVTVESLELHAPGVEESYEAVVNLLAAAMKTPICLLSIIDGKRQFFKSNIGLPVTETPRDISFCGHAIVQDDPLLVVEDASQDSRFADNPLVLEGPQIRFYAGAVISAPNNLPVGTVCAIDSTPRKISQEERQHLMRAKLLMESALNLRSLSTRDHLTGLYNRRHFDDYLLAEWRRAYRHILPISLLMIDVDHFKDYNDRFGHPKGDECLRRVAQAASGVLTRAGDLLARYGGEEFVAVLPATGAEAAHKIGERIREAIKGLRIENPGESRKFVTASVGGATAPDKRFHVQGAAALLAAADAALYEAKAAGRDWTVVRSMESGDVGAKD